jgi:hypothetical protein
MAPEQPGHGRGLADRFAGLALDPAAEGRVEGEHQPDQREGQQRDPREAPEVEARSVQQAAHGPGALGAAQHGEDAAAEEHVHDEVEASERERDGIDQPPLLRRRAREQAQGQVAAQQQVDVLVNEAHPEDVRAERGGVTRARVVPVAPPGEVEPAEHPLRRRRLGQRAFDLGGQRPGQHRGGQQVDDEQGHGETPATRGRPEAVGQGAERDHETTVCSSSRCCSQSR